MSNKQPESLSDKKKKYYHFNMRVTLDIFLNKKGEWGPNTICELKEMAVCGNKWSFVVCSGQVWAFGRNNYGQLGLGRKSNELNEPQPVPFLARLIVVHISCGKEFSIFNCTIGCYGVGRNDQGQLGLGHLNNEIEPQRLSFFDHNPILHISSGTNHTVCSCHDGAFGFGANYFGQLGVSGNAHANPVPRRIEFFDQHPVNMIQCGDSHTVCVCDDGVFSFGLNSSGQLGIGMGTQVKYSSPQRISFFDNKCIKEIAGGNYHTVCLCNDAVYGFGSHSYGKLGVNRPYMYPCDFPKKLQFVKERKVQSVRCGKDFTVCILEENKLHYAGKDVQFPLKHFFRNLKLLDVQIGATHSLWICEEGLYFFNHTSHFPPTRLECFQDQTISIRTLRPTLSRFNITKSSRKCAEPNENDANSNTLPYDLLA